MSCIVQVSPTFDLRHSALFLAGLAQHEHFTLRRDAAIKSSVVLRCIRNGHRVVIDLSDHADWYDEDGLALCDAYLKRSLSAPHSKVVPFGLNYSGRGTWTAMRAAFLRRDMRAAADLFRRAHGSEYEYPPDAPRERVVLLQTRLWEPDECAGDTVINEQRIELVASLQRAFGARFQGGLMDTPLARRLAPSLLAKNYNQREYIHWQKSAQVAVYTRGLFGSLAFKMAEYLASSKCIVSEPLDTMLPTPLVPDHHLRIFKTHADCVTQCGELLEDPGTYPQQAWQYYQRHVRLAADAVQQLMTATS